MTEIPNPGATEETGRRRTEVRLAKNLKDAQAFATRTGGTVVTRGGIPWIITYNNGDILWAGYPNKQPDIYEATPYINNRSPVHFNGFIGVEAAMLTKDSITLISPGLRQEHTIFECVLSHGQISERAKPIGEASRTEIKARDMARRESVRFMASQGQRRVRIERWP